MKDTDLEAIDDCEIVREMKVHFDTIQGIALHA